MSELENYAKQYARLNGLTFQDAMEKVAPHVGKGGARKKKGKKSRAKGGYEKMAEDILGYGGKEAQKGALAALLSGLNATIRVD